MAQRRSEDIRIIEVQELAAMRPGNAGEEAGDQGRLDQIVARLNHD